MPSSRIVADDDARRSARDNRRGPAFAAAGAASLAASGCASTTRSAGSGCVDNQFGTPRSLSSSTRASVARNCGTPAGSQPPCAAYSMPSRSDSRSSSRPYFRKATLSGDRRRGRRTAASPARRCRARRGRCRRGRARVLLRRVPRGDVRDLMAQHAGQLRLVVEIRQDAARDVDEAAGQRKRVDRRVIDDRERPRQVRPVRQRARADGRCPTT